MKGRYGSQLIQLFIYSWGDYKKGLLKGGQFHGVATENPKFLYDILSVVGDGSGGITQTKSLGELHLRLWLNASKAFQLLSPEVVMYVLYERTVIMTTSGVYNDK